MSVVMCCLDFLPPGVHTERGWIAVNNINQTSDVKIFAS